MKFQKNLGNRGFTLVELMIVIVIIGVLAALASFGFMQYVRKSKTAEADEFVKKLADGSRSYYTSEQKVGPDEPWFSTGNNGDPVAFTDKVFPGKDLVFKTHTDPPAGGTKVAPDGITQCIAGTPPNCKQQMKKLQFDVTSPMYFQYTYTPSGTGDAAKAEIKAIADFDGKGGNMHTVTDDVSVGTNGEVKVSLPYTENEFE